VAINSTGFDCVAGAKVVESWVVPEAFVHCTPEHGTRLVPVTINVAPEEPAVALAGKMDAMVGAGGVEAVMLKGDVFDRMPELDTSIFTVAADAVKEGGTTAVNCVELTKVVARDEAGTDGEVTHCTTEPFTKFAPVTVRVMTEGPQDGVVFVDVVEDETDATAGSRIANVWVAGQGEGGADGVMLNARMQALGVALPVTSRSAAGTVAVSCAEVAGDADVAGIAGT